MTVSLQRVRSGQAPPGWDAFVDAVPLPTIWSWPVVSAVAARGHGRVLAATIHDGQELRAIATVRLLGPRLRRGGAPLAGLADVDCLGSASLPGIACGAAPGTPVHQEAIGALQEALRRAGGRGIRGVLWRQVGAEMLPSVLRRPAIVREGGPIAVFRNRYADFDAYLAGLTKSRRWSLRRSVREVEHDPDLVVTFADADGRPSLRVEDVVALNNVVVRRHRRRWPPMRLLAPEMARAYLAAPGLRWLTYQDRTGRLLAYATVWDHPERPTVGTWGARAVDDGGRRDLWFHFNATLVRWCIERGLPGFVSGQGSIPEKLRLGHEASRQWAVLVPHRPVRPSTRHGARSGR
jgi:hypothetical protein